MNRIDNPYSAPSEAADASGREMPPSPSAQRIATRLQRLGAASLDGALILVLMFAGGMFAVVAAGKSGESGDVLSGYTIGMVLLPALSFYVFQSWLIATTGQSLGKRWLRIRIVRSSGAPVGFVRGVLIREWAMQALGALPLIGAVVRVIDHLMIFAQDSQCLHDRLADTIVIEA